MTRRAFAFVASLLIALPLAAATAVSTGFGRFLAAVDNLFQVEPYRVAIGEPLLELTTPGHALASDLQQSFRHEAHVARRASARNT